MSELSWMNQILRQIKNECNKVRSIQHILSRQKHSSSFSAYPEKLAKDFDVRVNLADSRKLTGLTLPAGLNFGSIYTTHMLKIEHIENYGGWQQPEITPLEEISLHPGAKVLHYAMTLFEGMKAFRGVDGKIRLFRPNLNIHRFNSSAERACLPQIDPDMLLKCIEQLVSIDQDWVPCTSGSSLYIRPTLIATDHTLGVGQTSRSLLYVILSPVTSYFSSGFQPIRLLADPQYIRAWPGGCGDKKMGSNYAPTTYVQSRAHELNCQQVLWLFGEEEQITEAGTMNVFMLYINEHGETVLATPPLSGCILPGITRLSLIELVKEWNEFEVVERIFTMPEMIELKQENRLLEFFGTGTACTICPVAEILYKGEILKIPTAEHANPVYKRLLDAILDIQYGRCVHPWAQEINTELYQYQTLQSEQSTEIY